MTPPETTDTTTRRPRGRPRKPQLIATAEGWSLRYWRMEEGTLVRRQVPLGTESKVIARARMKRVLSGEATPDELSEVETFEGAARRIVADQNIASRKDRMSRLVRFAFPLIGDKRITAITSPMVKDVLASMKEARGGKQTSDVKHLLDDVSSVLGTLYSDNVLPENVCKRIKFGGVQKVRLPRIVLSDAEFVRFACHFIAQDRLPEVVVMAICSRFLGGMRTSDLHAWLWEHIDTRGWRTALVPRPKTKKDLTGASPHAIDEQLRVILERWWQQEGRPLRGPVFPTRKDSRPGVLRQKGGAVVERSGRPAGSQKAAKGTTYVLPLRRLLWEAGVIRPTAAFADAERQGRALLERWPELLARFSAWGVSPRASRAHLGMGLGKGTGGVRRAEQKAASRAWAEAEKLLKSECEIQTGGSHNSPVDFHSFRRANATAAARAGLTPQEAMAITDHSDVATYMGYVRRETVVVTPEKMLPRILAPQMAEIGSAHGSNLNDSGRARRDSNAGPAASEAIDVAPCNTKTPAKRGKREPSSDPGRPPITVECQKPVPLIPGNSGALKAAIIEALENDDTEGAAELLDLARRRRARAEQTPKAAE